MNNNNNFRQILSNELYHAYLDARERKLATSNEFDFEANTFINFMSGRKDIDSIISYMGRLQHLDAQHLQRDLWAEVGLDYKLDPHGGPNSRFYTDGI